MKRIIAFISVIMLATAGLAQNPVRWDYSVTKTGDKQYEVKLTAFMISPWHIYSQNNPEDGIAFPTRISFLQNPLLVLEGRPKEEGKLVTVQDEVLEMELKYYAGKVEFIQTIQLKNAAKTNVAGSIVYMACTDERCLPPVSVNFSVPLN